MNPAMNPFDVNHFAPIVDAIKALPWLAGLALLFLGLHSYREAKHDHLFWARDHESRKVGSKRGVWAASRED